MEETLHDISCIDDIKKLVDTFYGTVRKDDLIGPIFNDRIEDRWPMHLEKMYHFWETVLLENHSYFGSPFPPHATLPIEAEHFNRWLEIFESTLQQLFHGPVADEALWRAGKMAQMFQYKLADFRKDPLRSLI